MRPFCFKELNYKYLGLAQLNIDAIVPLDLKKSFRYGRKVIRNEVEPGSLQISISSDEKSLYQSDFFSCYAPPLFFFFQLRQGVHSRPLPCSCPCSQLWSWRCGKCGFFSSLVTFTFCTFMKKHRQSLMLLIGTGKSVIKQHGYK